MCWSISYLILKNSHLILQLLLISQLFMSVMVSLLIKAVSTELQIPLEGEINLYLMGDNSGKKFFLEVLYFAKYCLFRGFQKD